MPSKSKPNEEVADKITNSARAYVERMADSHQRLLSGLETARARHTRIADTLFEASLAAQREAIELTKSVVDEPTAHSKNIEAVMDSLNLAQQRALDVGKTLYREQAEVGAEIRGAYEKYFAASGDLTKPFQKMTEMWMSAAK